MYKFNFDFNLASWTCIVARWHHKLASVIFWRWRDCSSHISEVITDHRTNYSYYGQNLFTVHVCEFCISHIDTVLLT